MEYVQIKFNIPYDSRETSVWPDYDLRIISIREQQLILSNLKKSIDALLNGENASLS